MKYRRNVIALLLIAANTGAAYAWTPIRDEFDPSPDFYMIMKEPNNDLGWGAEEVKKHENELTKMSEAIASDPKNGKLYLARANFNFELKKLEAAKSDYDKAIELDPTLAEAFYHRGKVYEYLGLQKSTQLGLDVTPKSLNMQGVKLDEDGDWPTAIKVIRLAVIREPNNKVYRRNLCRVHDRYGDYYLKQGDPVRAAVEYRLALDADSDHDQAKYRLKHLKLPKDFKLVQTKGYPLNSAQLAELKAETEKTKELYSAALENYKRAAELAPKNSKPYFRRAKVGEKSGLNDIISEYSQAIDLNKKEPTYYMCRARVEGTKGNLAGALKDYSTAIELLSTLPRSKETPPIEGPSPAATENFSDSAGGLKTRQDLAGDAFAQAEDAPISPITEAEKLEIEKRNEMELNRQRESDAFYERGLVLMKQEKWKDAKDDLTHAIEARIDNDDAFEKRSEIQLRLGDKVDADADMQEALRIRAGDKFSSSIWNPIEKF